MHNDKIAYAFTNETHCLFKCQYLHLYKEVNK